MDSDESPGYTVWQTVTPTVSQARTSTNHFLAGGRRASKACENCRQKKIKCDESQPSCRYCRQRKLACSYRKDHEAARDPTLHLISEKLAQLYDGIQILGSRLDKIETTPTATLNGQRTNATTGSSQSTRDGGVDFSTQRILETSRRNQKTLTEEPKIPRTAAVPSSSMLRWKKVQVLYPTVSGRYLRDNMSSAYSAIGDPSLMSPAPSTAPQNEPGQIYFYIRNFLSFVYPLYPILCEQAIVDMETAVTRDGVQIDVPSALILLMKTLGKLYSGTYDLHEHNSTIAHLDSAVRLLSWLPLEYTLEHAQAYTLAALCFAKLSMLSSSAFHLRQASAVLHEFLIRKILVPSAIKLTTRTTSIRLYWVLLNMERDLNWETNIYPHSQLGELEDRLPLPFDCMIEEFSSSGGSQTHMPLHLVIDSCYTLFLAETSLRQIIWRAATAPELHQGSRSSDAGTARNNMLLVNVIREIETQFLEWLACVPESAGWTPGACTGQITPLSSRMRIQYWFGRFQLYKASLYFVLNREDAKQGLDSLTLTWLHHAVHAAFNAINVFVLENFIPDDIFAHRILVLITVLCSAISALGMTKIISFCSMVTTEPESLLQRSIARLESLSSPSSTSHSIIPSPVHYGDATLSGKRVQSRWITEDLRNFHADAKAVYRGMNDGGNLGLRDLLT